jgi:hypothetical protein
LSYIGFIALLSFSSMVWETCGQGIHQVLANSMCRWYIWEFSFCFFE